MRRGLAALVGAATLLSLVGCSELRVARFRDDVFMAQYTYSLGESYVEVDDGLTLCYQEFGTGDETILVLPGLGTSIDFWQFNLPTWALHHRVLAVDLPGFGKSDKPDVDYDLLWICQTIVAFMDARDVERATIVGGSMGGHLALLMAAYYPERVDRLVLMGAVGVWPRPGVILDLAFRLLWHDFLVSDFLRGAWPQIYPKLFVHTNPATDQIFRYQMAVRANRARYRPIGRAASRALRSIFYHSLRDRLHEIRQPVLLLWGEHDRVHGVKIARFMEQRLPDARLVILPDAGHEAMFDRPDAFNAAVLHFIAETSPCAPPLIAKRRDGWLRQLVG